VTGVQCPRSGTLVDADLTDGGGVLIPTCNCGRVVTTDPGPTTGYRAIEWHRPLRTVELAGATR
jgi:hypothetical protein